MGPHPKMHFILFQIYIKKLLTFSVGKKNTENTIFKQKIRNIGIFNSFHINYATLQNSRHWRKNWKIHGKWKLKNLWQTFNHNHSIWNAAIINTQNISISEHFIFNSNYLIKYYIRLKINPFFKFLSHSKKKKNYIDKHWGFKKSIFCFLAFWVPTTFLCMEMRSFYLKYQK